jgi:uncharacterized protein (DUF58 family)
VTSGQRVVLILLVASLLGGIVSGSVFYYRLALRGVILRRTARSLRSQVGQIFEERFEVQNQSRLPRLWLEVRDNSPLPGSRGSQVLSLIGGRESRSYLVRTRLMKRGVFPLGDTVLSSGDLFGLFPVSQKYPAEESLLVYPMMVDVQAFPSPMGWLSGGEAVRRRTQQITANASGVREYEQGDPLNRIHWLSTARRNRFMVKEFELDPMAEVWIIVDAYRHVHAALPFPDIQLDEREMWRPSVRVPLPPSTEEYAVSVAASLARFYLQRGRVVGLISAGQAMRVLSAERGGRQLSKILETLALLSADGRLALESLVQAGVQVIPRGSTVVLITPDSGDGVSLTAELLMRRGMRPVVVLVEASSFGGTGKAERLENDLRILRIPVCRIANGDDLAAKLSDPAQPLMWN